MEEAIRKAEVLIEALPYIKKFYRKVIVIKYGGSILADDNVRKGVLEDIVFLSYMGLRPVLIHGGGPHISGRLRDLGKKSEFYEGMRITDQPTLKIVNEELESLNIKLVKEIKQIGAKSTGISGAEDKIINAEKKKAKVNLGRVGRIISINPNPIIKLIKNNKIVVVCPMGKDRDKKVYNINADEVASALAVALKAEKLVFLTDIDGIMRNPEDHTSFISTLSRDEAERLIDEEIIQQGMIPKVKSCIEGLNKGVNKTHIINACTPRGLLLEIFTDKGVGTEIIR
jgi:acetylglutamate kinase